MGMQQLWPLGSQWFLNQALPILLALLLAAAAVKTSSRLISRIITGFVKNKDEELKKRAETLGSILQLVLKILILFLAALILLDKLGIEIGPLIAAAGILGLAVAFGAQNIVQDVISGFFLLLEDQLRVGDVVQLDSKGGLAEKITLRMVILRDLAGNVHYVRNGKIDVVTNMTKDYSRYVFDIGVAYKEDVDHVTQVIQEVDQDMRNDPEFQGDILEPIEILGLERFAESAQTIRARIKTRPIKQWALGREYNRRLKKRFDQEGIEIPFPHLTLYMGRDKQDQSPPLRIQMQEQSKE